MSVEVITTYYKEEFLAPLFMMHYSWVDHIHVITQPFPDGKMDDGFKTELINAAIGRSTCEWIICVDFDEFVFPYPYGTDPRAVIEAETGDKIEVPMWRVWRHANDKDIDRMQPPVLQRLHGREDPAHTKPCIFRRKGVTVGIGCHSVSFPEEYKWGTPWIAVHWANADPCFGIDRSRRDRQERLSDARSGEIPTWRQPGFLEQVYPTHLNDPEIDIGLCKSP